MTGNITVSDTVLTRQREIVHPTYRPDIDGLRAVAALSVVIFHAFPTVLPGGFIGVDIFFVISGYLISYIIMDGLNKNCFSFSGFYTRRIKRIFPALILLMISVLAFGWISLSTVEYKQLGRHTSAAAIFTSNLVFWRESGYFDNAAITKPLLHLWSLGVEEQFYIFWPLFLSVFWRMRINCLLTTLGVAAISLGLNIFETIHDPVTAFYSPITRFWEPMVGAILAYITVCQKANGLLVSGKATSAAGLTDTRSRFERVSWQIRPIASLLGAGLIAVGIIFIREENFPGWQALIPVLGTALVIFAGPHSSFNRLFLSGRVMVGLGLISYPLYLWHWPLFSYARIVHGELNKSMCAVLLLLSLIMASLTYLLVERPLKRIKKQSSIVFVLIAVMVVVGCIGSVIKSKRGIEQRAVVRQNDFLETGKDGGFPSFVKKCSFPNPELEKLFQCYTDTREQPRFALLGDSKAGALLPGLFRTSTPGGAWVLFTSPENGPPLVPVLSDEPIYDYVNRLGLETASKLIEENQAINTVVIAVAARALFHLKTDYSISDLPESKNYEAALNGLDKSVSRLLARGKKVVLVIDNPTLPHPTDCLARKTTSAFFNKWLVQPLNPACQMSIAMHKQLSKQYRDMLFAIQARHPDSVSVFDTAPILCDIENNVCATKKNGRFLYGITDHISEYGSRLVGQQLNSQLNSGGVIARPVVADE